MSEEQKSRDPYFAKGCLGLVVIFVLSIGGAAALAYATQWLLGF